MPEEKEDKGFKVIDRRGVEAAPEPPSPPPKPPPKEEPPSEATEGGSPPSPKIPGVPPVGASEGSRLSPQGVEGEKRPAGEGASSLGGPRFLDIVQSLQMGAMIGLGMLQGPDGKRPPVDLPAAKDAIDLLGILQEKII
jgi:hypothetical protein